MKKAAALLLAVLMVLTLCACGGSAKDWQEQYDLGVRYLSEGDYENAVIAFRNAIQIDPKQVKPYICLADLYTQLGDLNAVFDILQQGLDATGSTELAGRIEEEKEKHPDFISAESSGENSGGSGENAGADEKNSIGGDSSDSPAVEELSSPETAPELPEPLQFMTPEMCDTVGEPMFTASNYVPTDKASIEALQALIDAGLSGDKETIWQLEPEASVWTPLITGGSNAAVPDAFNSVFSFWTVWGDSLLRVRYGTSVASQKDAGEFVMVDYREKDGTGFLAGLFNGMSGDQNYFYAQGKTTGWLLNGDTEFSNHFYSGWDQAFFDIVQTAVIADDMPDGPVTITYADGSVENYTFSAGSCPDWWSDPQGVHYGYMAGRLLG